MHLKISVCVCVYIYIYNASSYFPFSHSSKFINLYELHNRRFTCFQVYEDEPVLQAFKLMRKTRIGGVPVIERGGSKAVGNISLQDVQFLLTAPEIYHNYR